MIDHRILICAAASVLGHLAIAHALDGLPPIDRSRPPRTVEVRVIAPPKSAEPLPEPPAPPPEPPKVEPPKVPVHEKPRPRPTPQQPVITDVAPVDSPPVPNAPVTGDPTAKPVFGYDMESSPGPGSPAGPVGNTTTPQPAGPAPVVVKPLAAPAAAHEVTRMPLPQGRCAGKYTDAAREAGLEGVVVLDLIVDEQGRARDIDVVAGLDHGLTEAAIAALKACKFSPGEKDGTRVPVRVRGFKIRFVLDVQ